MGRRRAADGTDHLSDMVRRKNAVNEELTLAAMSENVWAAVESGRERRRRLACEREYGVGRPGAKPAAPPPAPVPAPAPALPQKVIPTPVETKPAVQKKQPEPSKQAAPAKAAAQEELQAAGKKGKTAKDASKSKTSKPPVEEPKAPAPASSPVVQKEPEIVAAASVAPVTQIVKQEKKEAKIKNDKPADVSPPPTKQADTEVDAKQSEESKQTSQESKKSKRGKKKSGRFSESDDKPATEVGTPASAPEAPLASNLPQMVSDEPPPVTTTPLSAQPAAPAPSAPVSIPTTLSYAEKAKHPPASPPHEEPPPPPAREESPEPLYDPVPRAHTPPPAPALAPISPVTEEWLPVETRKEKRRRRRSERASESERKSESAAEPDAFDLLLSSGEGLQEGLQEALDEEKVPPPPPPPAAAVSSAVVDAFDLLLSAADDLADGFQEAFGDEEEEPPKRVEKPAKKKPAKAAEKQKKENNKQEEGKEAKPAPKSEKAAVPEFSAFDLMLSDGDGLKEGFEEAFADEPEEPIKSPVTAEGKGHQKSKVKPIKANKREHKTSQSDKKGAAVVEAVSKEMPQEKSEKKENTPPAITSDEVPPPQQQGVPEDSKAHGKNKKPRSRKNSEKTKGRTPRQSTCSESEPVASAASPAAAEDMWFDKTAHDAAETKFHEDVAASAAPEVVSELRTTVAQSLPAIPEPEKSQGKGKKPRSRKNSEKTKQGRTPRASTCSESEPPAQAKDTVTWFDKAEHDAAETRFYEGMRAASGQPENQQGVLKKTSVTPGETLSRRSPERTVEDVCSSLSQSSVAASSPVSSPSAASAPAATTTVTASSTSSQSSAPRQATATAPAPSTAVPAADAVPADICSPPMSLSSLPEQYFEDVVLAARKSSATMAELPGFTAAPLSERLAPGEQLDSLRTEPELEPDEPSESHKAGKKRQRRRRRRSDRTSESERKSESEPTPHAAPEAVAEAAVPTPDPTEAEKNGEVTPGKASPTTTAENGTEPKGQQKPGKSRNQRRKKTKSTSSTGEASENGTVANKPAATPVANKSEAKTKSKTAPIPEAPAASSPAAQPAAQTSSASSDSLPSSPEHIISSSPEHDGSRFVPDDTGRRYASLMQQDADTMLPARPVFLAHACFVCKRLHGKQCRLKSCGSCRLVAYCSATHQRAHWPMHRDLCKVITKRMKKLGTDHLYREALNVSSHEQWKQIRFKHMTVCEEMLGRPMEAYEKEMFLYPRACETCHETTPEKLHTCHSCHSVSYCCEEHLRKNHSKFCKDLRLLVDIHTYQNQHGVCDPLLPDKMLTTYEPLSGNIREFLVVSMLGPVKAYGMGNIELAVLSEQASYPLSLLYALQNIPTTEKAHISQLTELTVHVVGAEFSAECDNVSKWDVFLLNVLPGLRRLHVVFIGPELEIAGSRPGITEEDFTCESCRRAGKRFTCEFQPNTYYHTYCRSPQFRPPQAICAFNAGIYRTTGHERRDSWRETIPHLVRDGVPLVLTAYTLLECPQDVARIQQEQKVDVLLPPMKNPFRSSRPAQNFLNEHESPLIYKNQYVACLSAAWPRK